MVIFPSVPTTWEYFKTAITTEFIPANKTQRARDELCKLKQTSSVEKQLSEYWNIVLMIGNLYERKKLDGFVDGLKYLVKVEVMKMNCKSIEYCSRVVLNIDRAI